MALTRPHFFILIPIGIFPNAICLLQTTESFYVDSSDCDELPEGSLARIQSQELLDQSLEGDAERKLRIKRAPPRKSAISKMEECLNYDPHRVQVDNYSLTDDETNDDDDIDDDVDQDDDESHGHGKFTQTVKDLTLSSNNVSEILRNQSVPAEHSKCPHNISQYPPIPNIDFIEERGRVNDINHDHLNDQHRYEQSTVD